MATDTYSELEDCHACPLCLHRAKVVMPQANCQWGNRYMAIGTFPSQTEDHNGLAFSDKAREQIFKGIIEVGDLDYDKVYKTYMTKCRPSDNKQSEGIEYTTCHNWMRYELYLNKPLVVIAFGRAVVEWFYSHFEPEMFGGVLLSTRGDLSWHNCIAPSIKRLVRETRYPEIFNGPLVIPFYDVDEILRRSKQPKFRAKLQQQIKALKKVVNVSLDIGPQWSCSLMQKEEKDG